MYFYFSHMQYTLQNVHLYFTKNYINIYYLYAVIEEKENVLQSIPWKNESSNTEGHA